MQACLADPPESVAELGIVRDLTVAPPAVVPRVLRSQAIDLVLDRSDHVRLLPRAQTKLGAQIITNRLARVVAAEHSCYELILVLRPQPIVDVLAPRLISARPRRATTRLGGRTRQAGHRKILASRACIQDREHDRHRMFAEATDRARACGVERLALSEVNARLVGLAAPHHANDPAVLHLHQVRYPPLFVVRLASGDRSQAEQFAELIPLDGLDGHDRGVGGRRLA